MWGVGAGGHVKSNSEEKMKIFSLIFFSITFPLVWFFTLLSSRSFSLHSEKKSYIELKNQDQKDPVGSFL